MKTVYQKQSYNACVSMEQKLTPPTKNINKNYYVVRNARCARSRYTLKLSSIFLDAIASLDLGYESE